jgi:hypothetical protein
MAVQTIRSRFFELRAFLVFAALISLCVSNNVGPCFLPLPAVTDHLVEQHRPNPQNTTVSRSSSRTGSESFRVPIMGQAQKRADKEHHVQPFAASPKAGIVLPDDAPVATELNFPISLFSSASVSQPPGRAPPRLV